MNEYDDLADLDEVFGPLRSTARPAELSQESATVDLMVNAHQTAEGKHMFTSRRAKIATLVAAGVLGFGGMAAASSPSFLGDEPTEEPTVVVEFEEESSAPIEEEQPEPVEEEQSEPVEEEQPAPVEEVKPAPVEEVKPALEAEDKVEVVPVEEEPLDDSDPDETTEFNEFYCEEGNHGKTVSTVARGVFDPKYPGEVTVKMAAQSSCGKTGEDLDEDEIEESEIEESEVEESESKEVEIEESESESEESEFESDESEVEKSEVEKSETKAERPGKSNKGAEKATNGQSNGNGKRGG